MIVGVFFSTKERDENMEKEKKVEKQTNEKNIQKIKIKKKINMIMSEVEYLKKDDTVITNQRTGAGYKAISEEKVTTSVRNAMIKYGVVIIPVEQEHRREDEILKDNQGNEKASRLTTVDTKYRIQNIDDKEDYIIAVSSGTGVDTQDKGIGKAMTYSYKYLLLRTFAIPTGEDTDKISSEVYDSQFNRNTQSLETETKEILLTENQKKIIDKLSDANKKKIIDKYSKNSIDELTIKEASEVISILNNKKEKENN